MTGNGLFMHYSYNIYVETGLFTLQIHTNYNAKGALSSCKRGTVTL